MGLTSFGFSLTQGRETIKTCAATDQWLDAGDNVNVMADELIFDEKQNEVIKYPGKP